MPREEALVYGTAGPRRPRQDDETSELRVITREVYKKTGGGAPCSKVEHFGDQLTHDRMVFIDTLFLENDYRGNLISQKILQSFHNLIQKLIKQHAATNQHAATILLSPAKSADVGWDNGKSEVEIERGLIRTYRKVDYDVWVKGDEKKPGSVTVLGRTI